MIILLSWRVYATRPCGVNRADDDSVQNFVGTAVGISMLGRNNAVIKIITLAGVGKINPRHDKLFVAAYTDNNMHIPSYYYYHNIQHCK